MSLQLSKASSGGLYVSVWIEIAIAAVIIVIAGALLFSHWREGKRLGSSEPAEPGTSQQDWRYRWARVKRRKQSSFLIGLLGVVLIVDAFLQQIGAAALWKILVITLAVVLTFWIAILAFADILATQRHFSQLRQQLFHEEARFLAQLRDAKTKARDQSGANSGNGKAFRGNRTKTSS